MASSRLSLNTRELLVDVRRVRARRQRRIETLIESIDDAEPETRTGRRHELQRPARARARHRVHLAAGFLREDAEQNRFGQSGLLVFRPHAIAHVLVVLVRLHQVRAVLRQPLLDRDLDRIVHRDHVGQVLAMQDGDGTLRLRQRGGDRRGLAGFGRSVRRHRGVVAARRRRGGRREAQQAIERGDEARVVAARRGRALRGGGLEIVERGGRIGQRLFGVAVAGRIVRELEFGRVRIETRVKRRHGGRRRTGRLGRRLRGARGQQRTRGNHTCIETTSRILITIHRTHHTLHSAARDDNPSHAAQRR